MKLNKWLSSIFCLFACFLIFSYIFFSHWHIIYSGCSWDLTQHSWLLMVDLEVFLVWWSVVTDGLVYVFHGALGHVSVTSDVKFFPEGSKIRRQDAVKSFPNKTLSSLLKGFSQLELFLQTHRMRIESSPSGSLRLFPESFPFFFFFRLSFSLLPLFSCWSARRVQALLPLLASVAVDLCRTRSPSSRLRRLLFNHRNTTAMITATATASPVTTPTTGHIQEGEALQT